MGTARPSTLRMRAVSRNTSDDRSSHATEGTDMQLAAITKTPVPTTPASPENAADQLGGIAEVKRGMFASHVSLVFGERKADFAAFDDALAAAKQLSAGPAPATVVVENRYTDSGSKDIPADQHFSVYGADFQEWKGETGGIMINSGPYHHGDFSRTKGYDMDNDDYSNGEHALATVLVDGDRTWSNGITPSA
jgi:hypothetical protein